MLPVLENADEQLVEQARYDRRAFAELYRRYADQVYRYLYVRVGNEADTRDLTSQTFIEALNGLGTYQSEKGSFVGWLMGIARHQVAQHYRNRRNIVSLDAAMDVSGTGPSVEDAVGQKIQFEQVVRTLQAIAPERAEALTLQIFGGLNSVEIGQVMGRSDTAVRMLIYRALRDLRRHFEIDIGEGIS